MTHTSAESSSSSTNIYIWLNGDKPRYYRCSLCHLSFKSMYALGGHQNAHRQHHNQMQKLINHRSKKKTYYYQFMPLKEANAGIYGYGCGFQNPLRRLMMPTSFVATGVPSYAALLSTNELDLSLKLKPFS